MNKIYTIFLLTFLHTVQSFAVMQPTQTYPTEAAFLASGDAPICEVLTDGCNEWKIQDEKRGDPIKACRLTADFVYTWSCTDYRDDVMFMTGTLAHQDTEAIGGDSDQTLRDSLLSQLSQSQKIKVSSTIEKYKKIESQFVDDKKTILREKFVSILDGAIAKIATKHMEKVFSISVKNILIILELLKLEIQLLDSSSQVLTIYTCIDDTTYTIYNNDYCIDDMCFPLGDGEIHISDGSYLLPNYIAQKPVSSQQDIYDATETEKGEKYSFSFQVNKMTVSQKDRIIHECTKK